MGRVRTKTVKKSSWQVIEWYYSHMTLLEAVEIILSKRLHNKIAGFSTHLMKRIQCGPVCEISLEHQEEEHERRMDFIPNESAINVNDIEIDKETMEMLAALGMTDLPGVTKQQETVSAIPAFGGGRAGAGAVGGGRRY